MDERKAALVEALAAKCAALLELLDADKGAAPGAGAGAAAGEAPQGQAEAAAEGAAAQGGAGEAFQAAFRELRKWVDTAADEKVRGLCHAPPGTPG